jgi:3-phosphoshikimate 1-carboxyvinyltransferase
MEIEVVGELVSRPFVDLTAASMRAFGTDMANEGYRRLVVRPGQSYRARDYVVEPDASAASYFFAAAAITGGRVRIEGLGRGSAQGDLGFVDVLDGMGCQVTRGESYVEVVGPADPTKLRGIDADMRGISDTALTLAAIAPFASGPVAIRGIAHTRLQESDRVAAAVAELRRLGARVDELPDGLVVHPSAERLHGAEVATYDDHRMAMSFALVGLRVPGVRILDPECVSKTFPEYFGTLDRLR